MYKPNFCAECGARVERVRWRPWTSGRFCPGCEKRFRRAGLARAFAACAVLLLTGFVAGRALRSSAPPLTVIERPATPTHTLPTSQQATGGAATNSSTPAPRHGPDGSPDERPTDPAELVSICGARTKKGTPCSRRVRGVGRCWQHKGRNAMLPPAKLIIQE